MAFPVFSRKMTAALVLLLILVFLTGTWLHVTSLDTGSPSGQPVFSPPGTLLTVQEQRWIADHREIVVCPDPEYPPFEFYDDAGQYSGITADYLRIIENKTGLIIIDTRQAGFSTCVDMVRSHEADILGAVFTSDLRRDYLNYTDPYYQPPLVIVTRDTGSPEMTLDNLNGTTIVAIEGYTVHELLKKQYPGITVRIVPNIPAALRGVSLGLADTYVGDIATTSWYARQEGLTNLRVAGEYRPPDPRQFRLAIGVRNDEPVLRDILNKGLAMITPEEKEAVISRWISSDLQPRPFDTRIFLILIAGSGLLLLIVGVTLAWNRSLKRAVDEKTRELLQELEERKRAQELLRESEKKYRTIIETIQDVYYRTDCTGTVVMVSPSAAALFGYDSADNMIGRNITERYNNPDDRKVIASAIRTKGFIQDFEVVMTRTDGSLITVSANSHLYTHPDGTPAGIEGLLRDISAQKLAREEMVKKNEELRAAYAQLAAAQEELNRNFGDLARSQEALNQARMKLNLLNTVALQDIQNAIFSLSGYFELEKDIPKDAALQDFLEKQIRIVRTITESLEFIKKYQNLGLTPPRWQNVYQTFLLAISHLDFSAIRREVDVGDIEIYADALLEEVFVTLAENVLIHGKHATGIRFFFREGDEGLVFVFEDNGTGIPLGEKAKIFERRSDYQKGMGLFLAHEILSVTGISIRECGEPGTGARFEITVPKGEYRFFKSPNNPGVP